MFFPAPNKRINKENQNNSADLLAKAIRRVFDEAMDAAQEHTDGKLEAMEGRINNRPPPEGMVLETIPE